MANFQRPVYKLWILHLWKPKILAHISDYYSDILATLIVRCSGQLPG
jgi:hypothetical protein